MAGTEEGGKKTAEKNVARDPDFYKKIGAKGGRKSKPTNRPFAKDRELARKAAKKGLETRWGKRHEKAI